MKLTFDVNSNCHLAIDVDDVKQAFKFIAYVESVFGVDRCGNCPSSNLRLTHRSTKEGYDYYSVVCKDCRHELKFGQQLEANGGRLFQKGWEPPYSGDDGDGAGDVKNQSGESESREPAQANTAPW